MDPKLPSNFIKVSHAFGRHDGKTFNIIGVISDYLPVTKTRGSDYTVKVTLWDDSCSDMSGGLRNGMDFRFFHKNDTMLPSIQQPGDVMVLRNVRMMDKGSSRFGITTNTTIWGIIKSSDLPNEDNKTSLDITYHLHHDASSSRTPAGRLKPDKAEVEYARQILHLKNPSEYRNPPAHILEVSLTQNQPMQKYRKVEELVPPPYASAPSFADLFCEIRKVYDGGGSVIELKVTDYTENQLLYNNTLGNCFDGDEYGHIQSDSNWPGPWGKMSLKIEVWDEHAAYVRNAARQGNLALGSYVLFQNVSIKMERSGSQLQGHCRGGGHGRGGLTVYKPREAGGDQRFKDLLQRKRDYEAQAKRANLPFISQFGNPCAKDIDQAQARIAFSEDRANNKKRNAKRREKREQVRKLAKQNGNTTTNDDEIKENEVGKVNEQKIYRNQNVRCKEVNITLKTVADILDQDLLTRTTPDGAKFSLPFQNCKYKSRVQVVDFFPDHIEDFAVPRSISDYDALSDNEDEDCDLASLTFARNNPDSVKWIWQFFLLVRDPCTKTLKKQTPMMLMQVADQDGDLLLNAEACDLRANPEELAKLKEKLFVLWGDLQEKKEETGMSGEEMYAENAKISSWPFECFIKEYGMNARDEEGDVLHNEYERMFRMFDTRIC